MGVRIRSIRAAGRTGKGALRRDGRRTYAGHAAAFPGPAEPERNRRPRREATKKADSAAALPACSGGTLSDIPPEPHDRAPSGLSLPGDMGPALSGRDSRRYLARTNCR